MEVIPAIDLRGGRCVRLYQGDYARETVYSDAPAEVAARWIEAGASRLHVIDLDGAKVGAPANLPAIRAIAAAATVPVQLGGGIRTLESARAALDLGVDRVLTGTAAVSDPGAVAAMCDALGPEAVVVTVDARDGLVALDGWTRGTRVRAADLMRRMAAQGVVRFLYTDIARDGTLSGPNYAAIEALRDEVDARLIAAGGISSVEHLLRLRDIGVEAAVVGKAIYTGDVNLPDAIQSLKPKGKQPMSEKFDHHDKAELLSADRYETTDPQRLISMLPVLVYHEVADIGCGPGFFTIPFAKYLFDGKVYAIDVQQEMLDAAQEQVREVNLTNVEMKLAGETELPLEDDSLDGAFIAFVLHETESPTTMLSEARRCLRKGGWLAALEHKETAEDGPPVNRRLDESEVGGMARDLGFRIETAHNLNDHHYMLVMRK